MSLLVPLTCRSPSISAISSMCSKFYAKTRSYGLLACISPCVGVDVALPYCVYLWQSVSPFLTSLSIWVPSRTTSPFARLSYCNQSCPSSSVCDTDSSYLFGIYFAFACMRDNLKIFRDRHWPRNSGKRIWSNFVFPLNVVHSESNGL